MQNLHQKRVMTKICLDSELCGNQEYRTGHAECFTSGNRTRPPATCFFKDHRPQRNVVALRRALETLGLTLPVYGAARRGQVTKVHVPRWEGCRSAICKALIGSKHERMCGLYILAEQQQVPPLATLVRDDSSGVHAEKVPMRCSALRAVRSILPRSIPLWSAR